MADDKSLVVDGEVVNPDTGEIQEAPQPQPAAAALSKKFNFRDLTEEEIGAVEAAMMTNNYGLLSPAQRVFIIMKKCEAMGVNFFLQPFSWGTIDKKLVPVPNKGLFQQLREKRNLQLIDIEEDWSHAAEYGILTVRMTGQVGGRQDREVGVVGIKGLTGEPLANEIMTAYTKAHNRLTGSMCGGDASGPSDAELPTIPGAYLGEERPDSIKTIQPGGPGERNKLSFTKILQASAATPPPIAAQEAGPGKMQPPVQFLDPEPAPPAAPPSVSAPPTPAPIKVGSTVKPQAAPDKPKIMKAT